MALYIAGTAVASTAAELNILDGVTSTAAELNIMDGVTSTAAELNILDGVSSSASEINFLDGASDIFDGNRFRLLSQGAWSGNSGTDPKVVLAHGTMEGLFVAGHNEGCTGSAYAKKLENDNGSWYAICEWVFADGEAGIVHQVDAGFSWGMASSPSGALQITTSDGSTFYYMWSVYLNS